MAQVTITINDASVARVLDALCGLYNYNPAVHGTKVDFAKQCLMRWLQQSTLDWEAMEKRRLFEADNQNEVTL